MNDELSRRDLLKTGAAIALSPNERKRFNGNDVWQKPLIRNIG